jgi:hypothetical protein
MILLLHMSQPNSELPRESPEPVAVDTSWIDHLDELLADAAKLAAAHGLEADAFVQAAWQACLEARPGLREEIEDKEWRAQLKKLRKRGLVGAA